MTEIGDPRRPASMDNVRSSFGSVLSRARRERRISQEKLGKVVDLSRVTIANYENSKAVPSPEMAVALAQALGEDPAEFLLLTCLYVPPGNRPSLHLVEAVDRLRSLYAASLPANAPIGGPKSHLSLADGIRKFTPLKILVGDRREDEPKSAGDLFFFSASPVDDRWVSALQLPPATEKISDKVLLAAGHDRDWLRAQFGNAHILCLGSPAANIYARLHNSRFLFRFAISSAAQKRWDRALEEMRSLETRAQLLRFRDASAGDLRQTMRMFKPPGFVDFNYRALQLAMDTGLDRDFAVISLGAHPFADRNKPFFAILVAGVAHPGTAHALRFLSNRHNFINHPFGGVLEIDVPSHLPWHDRIEKCDARWHTTRENLEYTPESLREKLVALRDALPNIITDIPLRKAELDDHIALIDRLASAKRQPVVQSETISASEAPGDDNT